MIKFIEGLPDNVIAIEAVGKVDADDYKNVLDPAIAKALAAHDRVRFLCLLGEAYEGYTTGAMWQDTKVGLGDRDAWERIAVVSDHHALLDAVKLFAWMVPGEVRTYPLTGLDDAKAWLSES